VADGPSAIIGFGVTGRSLSRWLTTKNESFKIFDSDRALSLKNPHKGMIEELHVTTGWSVKNWEEALDGVDRLYLSPGVSLHSPAVLIARDQEIPVLTDLDLFNKNIKEKPVIGVTGTNGKSTVVALIGHLFDMSGFSVAIGGNYGKPALDLLEEKADIYVLELSSFQLEKIQNLNLHTGVFLNFSDDHLDYHGSTASYLDAKRRIFDFSDRKLFYRQDKATFPDREGSGLISFGFGNPAESESWGVRENQFDYCILRGSEEMCSVPKAYLGGRVHYLLNIVAALASIYPFNSAVEFESIESFEGLRHRFELVNEVNGVRFINDSKATNVSATEAALRNFESKERVILILGGDAKGVDLSILEMSITMKVSGLVILALDPAPLLELGQRCGIETFSTISMVEAVREAYRLANTSADAKNVILSPACASFDLFTDYQDRGRSFEAAVNKLSEIG
jgi:UDP-N-acetylmuramoylalanine--D-glutamate ligase